MAGYAMGQAGVQRIGFGMLVQFFKLQFLQGRRCRQLSKGAGCFRLLNDEMG
jgi:hypothetical protein